MDWRIELVVAAMEQELDRPLSLGELSARVNLSGSRLAHLFRNETGCAPARFLKSMRLDRAKWLVETSVLSIKEVMAQVGFNDPSHFAREFKRRHGASPRKIRARARSPGKTRGRAAVA